MRDCRVVKEPTQQVPGVGFEPTRTGSKPASLPVSRPRSVTTEYTEHTEMENTRVPRSTRFLSVSSVSSVVFSPQAEGEGVEPSRPLGSAGFKTAPIAQWLARPFFH